MKKQKTIYKIIALICIASILNYDFKCYAQNAGDTASKTTVGEHEIYDISDAFQGSPAIFHHLALKQPVYIIEDAHCFGDIQKNIFQLLHEAYYVHSAKTIFVEGCYGEQDYNYLRSYPLHDEKTSVLNKYLKRGIISGVELFSSTIPYQEDLSIIGLETHGLYEKNKETLRTISDFDNSRDELYNLKAMFQDWFIKYSSKELSNALNALSGDAALEYISDAALEYELIGGKSIISDFPELADYIQAIKEISSLNFDSVILESFRLLRDTVIAGNNDIDMHALRFRFKALYHSPTQSHGMDKMLVSILKGNPDYKNLAVFLEHTMQVNSIGLDILDTQIESFKQNYLILLCANDVEISVLKSYFDILKLEKFVSLYVTPDEISRYMDNNFLDVMKRNISALPAPLRYSYEDVLSGLDGLLSRVSEFYSFAILRDSALCENFLTYYEQLSTPCAVVLGGFHVNHFVKFLRSQNIPYEKKKMDFANLSNLPDRKVYFQHFTVRFDACATAVNPVFLAPEPILSASSAGVLGPASIWFNDILGELVSHIKPFPALAFKWVSSIRSSLEFSRNKIRNLIILSVLASMLAMPGMANAQTPPHNPATPPGIVQVLPQDKIDEHLRNYDTPLIVDQNQIVQDILSGNRQLQEEAFELLDSRGQTQTYVDIFKQYNNDELRRVILGRLLRTNQYSTVSQLFVYVTDSNRVTEFENFRPLFDNMVKTAMVAQPDFFSSIRSVADKRSRQSLKYMLIYYAQITSGSTQTQLFSTIENLSDQNDLYAIYGSYDPALQHSGKVWRVFHHEQQASFYRHGSVLLRDFARQKLVAHAVASALEKQITAKPKSKGFIDLLYRENITDAQHMMTIYKSGEPVFLEVVQGVFPEMYKMISGEMDESLKNFIPANAYMDNGEYAPLNLSARAQVLQASSSQGQQFDLFLLDRSVQIGDWTEIDNALNSSLAQPVKINILQHYVKDNIPKLVQLYEVFENRNPELQQVIMEMIGTAFVNSHEKYFPVKTYNQDIYRALIYYGRHQNSQGQFHSSWLYLLDSVPDEYSLHHAEHTQTIAGIPLSNNEIEDIRRELKIRFLEEKLQERLNEKQHSASLVWLNPISQTVETIYEDLDLLQSGALDNPDIFIEKYGIENEFANWQKKHEMVYQQKYYRPSVFMKLIEVTKVPFLAIFGIMLSIIFGSRIFSLKKVKVPTAQSESDPFSKEFNAAVLIIDSFAQTQTGSITSDQLDDLKKAVTTLDGNMKYHINATVAITVMEKLAAIFNDTSDSSIRDKIQSIDTEFKKNLKSKTKRLVLFESLSKKTDTEKTTFKDLISNVMSLRVIQELIINQLGKIIYVKNFEKNYHARHRKVMLYKGIAVSAKLLFFAILIATPFSNVITGFSFIVMVLALHSVDIFMYYTLSRNYDYMAKWFAFHLSRAAKFDNRISVHETASAIINGEAAIWATGQSLINFVGTVITIFFLSPWYILPYLVFLVFGVLRWRSIMSNSEGSTENTHYSPLYDIVHKVQNPALAVAFGAVVETFIVTQLLEAITKTGSSKFINEFKKSFHQIQTSLGYLDGVISDDNALTARTWRNLSPKNAPPRKSPSVFHFERLRSNIVNGAQHPVIDDISLTFKKGELAYIDALPGMGKSTLGRMLALYRVPGNGNIHITTGNEEIKISSQTVSHKWVRNIFKYLKFKDTARLNIKDILQEANEDVEGFNELAKNFIPGYNERVLKEALSNFSTDEKRFLTLLLYTYINRQTMQFLVLDDLFVGLHSDTNGYIMKYLNYLTKEKGMTVVVIESEAPESVRHNFDSEYILSAGKIVNSDIKKEYNQWLNKSLEKTADNAGNKDTVAPETPNVYNGFNTANDETIKFDSDNLMEQADSKESLSAEPDRLYGSEFHNASKPTGNKQTSVNDRYLTNYLSFLTQTRKDKLLVKRFNDSSRFSQLPVLIHTVLNHIKQVISTKGKSERERLISELKNGSREQKIAARIISRIKPDTRTNIVQEVVRYVLYSDIADDFNVGHITENELIDIINNEMQLRKLALFITNVVTLIQTFGEEDIPHRMRIWRDYNLPDAKDEEKAAASIITHILENKNEVYQADKKEFQNIDHLVGMSVSYIISNPELSGKYGDIIRRTPLSKISQLVEQDMQQGNKDALTVLNSLGLDKNSISQNRSVYELWNIKSLFEQYNISPKLFPIATQFFTYHDFRTVLFSIIDSGLPVTEETLLENVPQTIQPVPLERIKYNNVFDTAA